MSLPTLLAARGSTLLDALELHLPGARDHADGTAAYALAAAAELGLSRERAEGIREAARLHEIGKVYVPGRIIAEGEGELEGGERELLDSHASYGADLARGAGIPDDVCDWIAATRERFDGAGPEGLAGEEIPLEARIIRVACACDAALSDRGEGSPRARAIERLRAAAGRELDPTAVEALVAIIERAA